LTKPKTGCTFKKLYSFFFCVLDVFNPCEDSVKHRGDNTKERLGAVIVRKAELRDVPAIFKMIGRYAAERVLLPRPLTSLYEDVWEFTVAEHAGRLVGCAALKFYNQELAEVRSLCVDSGVQAKGVGRRLVDSLMDEAERYGLKKVFALTKIPAFFAKLGFEEATRDRFPVKVFQDCMGCPKYSCCDETAVSCELAKRHSRLAELDAEPARAAS
jgi:amino-acid N-acetyltransferase